MLCTNVNHICTTSITIIDPDDVENYNDPYMSAWRDNDEDEILGFHRASTPEVLLETPTLMRKSNGKKVIGKSFFLFTSLFARTAQVELIKVWVISNIVIFNVSNRFQAHTPSCCPLTAISVTTFTRRRVHQYFRINRKILNLAGNQDELRLRLSKANSVSPCGE